MEAFDFKVTKPTFTYHATKRNTGFRPVFTDTIHSFKDTQWGGVGSIAGTVVKLEDTTDVPVSRRVSLHRQRDGMWVRATWSDPVTGEYEFTSLRTDTAFFVIAFDHTGEFGAIIGDKIYATKTAE